MNKYVGVCVAAAALSMTSARAADTGSAEGFRFQFGLTFVSGLSDLLDKIQANNPRIAAMERLPGGLAIAVYHEFGNGLAVGATVGPILLARGDASFQIIPVGVDMRYRVAPSGAGGLYIRAGVEKANASGDFIASTGAGGTFAIGYDFASTGRSGWGLEAGYHSSEVTVKATPGHREQKARPTQGTLAAYWLF